MVTKSKPKPATSGSTNFKGYSPYNEKKGEEYMNDAQKEHFRGILNSWKTGLMREVDRTVDHTRRKTLRAV